MSSEGIKPAGQIPGLDERFPRYKPDADSQKNKKGQNEGQHESSSTIREPTTSGKQNGLTGTHLDVRC